MADSINDDSDQDSDDNESVEPVNINNTVLNSFSQGVALYLSQSIFPLIVQRLGAQGVNLTVEELMNLVSAPYSETNTNNTSSNNNSTTHQNITPTAFTGSAPIMMPKKPPVANNTVPSNASQNPLPGKCNYKYKRGDNKGYFCIALLFHL